MLGCSTRRAELPPPGPPAPRSITRGSRAEIDDVLQVVSGTLPGDLEGHAFVVGGVPYGDGTQLFNGDGMIYRFSFEGGRPRIKTRMVRTDDFRIDEATAGRGDMAFKSMGFLRLSTAFGARDFCNTALVPMNGRLLATYDAGRPWEIDPLTLEPVTPVGLQSAWRPFLPPLSPGLEFFPVNMSTAHPVWDADEGALYTVNLSLALQGLSTSPFLRILRWDGKSEPTATEIVDASGQAVAIQQSLHQMCATRNWLVLSDGAFNIEGEQILGQDVVRPQLAHSIFWLVRKADLRGGTAKARRIQLDKESAHLLVDRDDSGDLITLHVPHNNASDPSEWLRPTDVVASGGMADPALAGMMVSPGDLGPMGRYTVNAATGEVLANRTRLLVDERLWGTTLWTRDERQAGAPVGAAWWVGVGFLPDLLPKRVADVYSAHASRVVPAANLPKGALPPRIYRFDHASVSVGDYFEMPIGHLPMSPTFVPRRNGGADDGYLVLMTCGPDADEVWIMDAADLSAGPLCRMRHPQLDIGFTLHTAWMGDLQSPPAGYRVSRQDDYGARLAKLDPAAQELARSVLGIA
jgi:carotenoid cleavage dioxygenase-like enzyme